MHHCVIWSEQDVPISFQASCPRLVSFRLQSYNKRTEHTILSPCGQGLFFSPQRTLAQNSATTKRTRDQYGSSEEEVMRRAVDLGVCAQSRFLLLSPRQRPNSWLETTTAVTPDNKRNTDLTFPDWGSAASWSMGLPKCWDQECIREGITLQHYPVTSTHLWADA